LGQTGEKAAPQLYVAVAISGSSQHIGGIVGSRKIIAINKDVEAPIFGVADYGVVGQYEDVVPALVEKLRELA
jgi:electron transfer flavoprotein alpha subunit